MPFEDTKVLERAFHDLHREARVCNRGIESINRGQQFLRHGGLHTGEAREKHKANM